MDQTFSLFPRLPLEVRLMIWKFCTPLQPRIIELRLSHWVYSHNVEKHDFVAAIPSVLHTCHDARVIGLKTYKLSFDSPNAKRPVYFSPHIDSLFVRERFLPFGYYMERELVKRVLLNLPKKHEIQRLIISLHTALHNNSVSPPVIFDFPNLKEITFVRHVSPATSFPCREAYTTAEDSHLLSGELDTSSTPLGFTHFVKLSELQSGPNRVHMLSPKEFCLECPQYTFARQTSREYHTVMQEINGLEYGVWGDRPWNRPRFRYGAVSYDTIPAGKFFYQYEPYNFRPTTTRKTLESKGGITYGL